MSEIDKLINKSVNIPSDIKPIVKSICKAYIRESNGLINIQSIMNVCNTKFIKINEDDKDFSGEDHHFAETIFRYDNECNIRHELSYLNSLNYIKLISILTHELGHVITEQRPLMITKDGLYPLVKRTTGFLVNAEYDDSDNELMAYNYGYRVSDGFLESISTKIFASSLFRNELKEFGYDLKDYMYKDERLFPSRVYDEFKACFELYDYVMGGALTKFSCITFNSNKEIADYINNNKLQSIYKYLDKSNDAFFALKVYEGKEADDRFNELLKKYLEEKENALNLAIVLLEFYNKKEDEEFKRLFQIYKSTLDKQKLLPINKSNYRK